MTCKPQINNETVTPVHHTEGRDRNDNDLIIISDQSVQKVNQYVIQIKSAAFCYSHATLDNITERMEGLKEKSSGTFIQVGENNLGNELWQSISAFSRMLDKVL